MGEKRGIPRAMEGDLSTIERCRENKSVAKAIEDYFSVDCPMGSSPMVFRPLEQASPTLGGFKRSFLL